MRDLHIWCLNGCLDSTVVDHRLCFLRDRKSLFREELGELEAIAHQLDHILFWEIGKFCNS